MPSVTETSTSALGKQGEIFEPKHGWAIAKRIQQISGEVLQVQQGSLYPALHRLVAQTPVFGSAAGTKAWIKAKWKETETGRQAKFYSLTAAGRAQLEKEAANWNRLSAAISLGLCRRRRSRCHHVGSTILAQVTNSLLPQPDHSTIDDEIKFHLNSKSLKTSKKA
jgi:PadR family transcriptional regulator, regulatory protein PadR